MRLTLLTTALVAPFTLAPQMVGTAQAQSTAPALETLARPDDEARGLLWGNASFEAPKTAPAQKDVMDTMTKSFGLLSDLRS